LDSEKLDQIASKTKFLIRKRKLTPSVFLDLSFYSIDSEVKSLSRVANAAREDHSVIVSKQAINRRFSSSCISFFKELIQESISSQVTTTLDPTDLQLFKRVRIKDSTTFGVQDSLSDMFEGYGKGGGPSSKAGISIQYEFDLKTNKILDIDLQSAVARDCTDAVVKKDDIQEGDLIIRDLGYYSGKVLEHVLENGAFIISRLYQTANVYDQKKERIDFQMIYHQMMENKVKNQDIDVYIGSDQQPVKLIIELLPESIYQKRIIQRHKENKSRGYNISNEFKGRAHFNLFISNAPRSNCSWDTISKLYRIRWQIELVFKIWKSILNIDKLKKCSNERFLTMLYTKLLWIFINWKIISDCRNYFYLSDHKIMSLTKCFQTLGENSKNLRKALVDTPYIEIFLLKIMCKMQTGHWMEKRKKRHNFEEIIDLIFCKSEK
jgi:hypothetical protein